jgi:hypothetical protein
MLNCKPLKVAAEGNSASETIWGTIECPGRAVNGKPNSDQKHATQDEARIEQMQPAEQR